jgi:hypothetical protein
MALKFLIFLNLGEENDVLILIIINLMNTVFQWADVQILDALIKNVLRVLLLIDQTK